MPENRVFLSPFATLIENYIAEKRAAGYKFEVGAKMLKRFDSFVHSRGLTEVILTKQLMIEWTMRKPNETISTQCGRISLLRGLGEYMNRVGYPTYTFPRSMVTVDRCNCQFHGHEFV